MKNPRLIKSISPAKVSRKKIILASLVFSCAIACANAQNTSYGTAALQSNTSGTSNTALGTSALANNTSGSANTATGYAALFSNTTGNYNTANGGRALQSNTIGRYNTATGYEALASNTTAEYNTANGANALGNNTSGESNSAFGVSALKENQNGHYNTAMGVSALRLSTTGSSNSAFGYQALQANTTGSNNTAIGYRADVTSGALTNATAVGANAKVSVSNAIQLGDASVTQIFAGTGSNVKFITGTIQIRGGTPGAGKVLTSDAQGNAVWQTPSGGTAWVLSGSNLSYSTGIVSIGTNLTPNGYKLAVGGKVLSEELVVKLASAWPDYVFDENYKLRPLSEVAKYIRAHKHLPEVPSARQIHDNGLNVGEMNAILLKKIEELTLHMIELEKRFSARQNEIDALKKNK